MPQVLTTNAIVLCPHGGRGTTIPVAPIFSVAGGVVCSEGDPGTLACPFLPYPCIGYTLRSMGFTKSTIAGKRIVMTTDFNQTLTGLPLTMTETHQVVDDSTTVAIPNGASAPALPAPLLDMTPPVVTAIPPVLAFNSATMQPVTAAAAFSLVHASPARWALTLISEPQARNQDVTAGLPPALVVTPADGAWTTPALTVQLTMTAAYMASLGPGRTHFFLTGVSQRGLTAFAELTLTVT